MPEGHVVHRHAKALAEAFLNTKIRVSSPQGRFADQAELVSGRRLVETRAVGKQLFIGFDNLLAIRVHLGIYGKWNFHSLKEDGEPEVWGQVRARLAGSKVVADLRGPTVCEVITLDQVEEVIQKLGPDPLNPDPKHFEQKRFIERAISTKAPIAAILMNQNILGGIGNVYRAELLFRARLDPMTPGNSLSEAKLKEIWEDAKSLLRIGFKTGVMLTRDDFRKVSSAKEDRHFVYKREGLPCRECGKKVSLSILMGRKLYWCPSCQK